MSELKMQVPAKKPQGFAIAWAGKFPARIELYMVNGIRCIDYEGALVSTTHKEPCVGFTECLKSIERFLSQQKMQVPVLVRLDAGLVGTEDYQVLLADVTQSTFLSGFSDLDSELGDTLELQLIANEHAESYGICEVDCGVFEDEDGGEMSEPEWNIMGIYNPHKHDGYSCGGGSFLADNEIRTAYENMLEVAKGANHAL